VLEAVAELPTHLTVRVEIAGVVEHHRYWEHCQELVEAATAVNDALTVRYHGHLGYSEVDALFASSDVVVIPSKWPEPLGAVAAEALRAGAMVVASRVGGLGTYIKDGETGLLLEPDDIAGWATALQTVANRPDLARRMGAAGAAAVAGLTAQAHVAALDDLIGRLRP
jgi:glycosyltransferase involved in cell wall biosynthesis